jgi:exodeoxyribonuclease VII large subunit
MLDNAIRQRRDHLGRIFDGFLRGAQTRTREQRQKLEALERLRNTLGYQATLERGYTVVRDGEGALVTDVKSANASDVLEIQFADGRVSTGEAKPLPAAKPKAKRKPTPDGSDQGSLF